MCTEQSSMRGERWVVGGESICAYAVTVLDKNDCPFLFLGLGVRYEAILIHN